MEVDAEGEPEDNESVCHSNQDELADEEASDESSPTPSAATDSRQGWGHQINVAKAILDPCMYASSTLHFL